MEIEKHFAEFWLNYPHRPGDPKKPAFIKYRVLVEKGKHDPAVILAGTKAFAATRLGENSQFTPMARTFLHREQFLAEFNPSKVNETVLVNGFYAAAESPQLAAWDAKYLAAKGMHGPRDRKGGWWFPTEWPPDGNVVSMLRKTA